MHTYSTHIHIYVRMCIRMYACKYGSTYICTCISMCIHTDVCDCVDTHTHTHTHKLQKFHIKHMLPIGRKNTSPSDILSKISTNDSKTSQRALSDLRNSHSNYYDTIHFVWRKYNPTQLSKTTDFPLWDL